MSIRSKVNVVNSVQYPSSLRRFMTEAKDETSAGIFSSGSHAWVTNGDKLSIVDTTKGCLRPVYSFGEDSKDPVDITCIEELVLDCTTPIPLLLVGTSSLYSSQLCVFNPAHSRVIRAIQLDDLQVRCMAVVEDGRSPLNSLTDTLSAMEGVIALGCADGSVVLVDLNRQTIITAYQGNLLYRSSELTPQPIKFVSMADEEATITEINEAQQIGASSAITLIEGDDKDTEFGVTALSFSRETACLYIGYSSGLWQIWNLSFPTFTMMYECAECTSPVSSFCQIEPCEDPRPTVYLWVNHEGTDSSMPLLNMYTLSYANKHNVHDFGIYYQDFISCSLSFTMYPGEEFPNVTSGRLVSAKAYSKTIKRHLIQNMGLPDMEGIQMKLVATTFSLTFTRGSTHTYLCIFDLDQWYKEQMPHEPTCDAPYIETSELSSEPLLASTLLIDSISLYHTEEPQEIHLVPQALSFKVIGLSESGLMTIEKIGLQKLWLANTEAIGAKSLIHPTKLFHACVSSGLVPMFPAHQNPETSAPTNEEMRSYIMSVCLDNGLIKVILDIGEQWESGVHAMSNCTLKFLFDWVWSSVSAAYKSVNSICDTLFSASGHELDVSLKRRLQLCRLILDRLYYIHTAFCSKYSHTLYADSLEPRLKAIDIITLFVHQVTWFVNVGLLPEANSKDLPKSATRYEYLKLDRFALDRRQRLNSLFTKFKRAGKAHEMPGAGLYLVDHFVHDYSELGQQWEDEGGSTAYPPPSLQSLLRSIRIPTVPTATKLALVQYTLLDIMSVIDKAKNEDKISKVSTYCLLPKMNATQTKVINGLWHLDHSLYEEGLRYLLDRTVTVSDLSESLHRAILRMLLFEGKEKLAIQYLRLKNPPLSLPDDLKLEMSLLLANKLTSEAYHFQREHTYLRVTLLRQLITECLANGEIGKLVNFPLDASEINFFHSYLAENRCQRNDDLRVLLHISRSKYNEAKVLHEQLLASSTDRDPLKSSTRDMIVNGLASTLCPISRMLYLQKIDPNLKNLPEFKSSKPRPMSVYVKTIDDGGFPNFAVSSQKLCASAIACSANLRQFIDRKSGKSQVNDILRGEPMICSEENTSLWSKQDSEVPAPGKRARTWVSGANKRQRMDEDATVQDDDIAAFVGTPLVKRRSRELADPTTPNSIFKRHPVHSILKSGKTPGTPGRSVPAVHDDMDTPKKTLRWDIPTSEPLSRKEAVKKSLLSASLLTPSEESASPPQDSVQTPQGDESIKSRLRSHTPTSTNKKDVAIWAEIAEEAKAKVLFSLNLPTKKEKKLLPSKPTGPSFVVQINQLIEEEKIRKENEKKKEIEPRPGEFTTVSFVDDANADVADEKQTADPKNEDVEMRDATPSSSRGKRLKFLDLTIGSDEISLLDTSGSPFTTTAIPKELRQQLRAKLRSPHGQVESCKVTVEQKLEPHEVEDVAQVQPTGTTTESLRTPKKVLSPVKRHSKVLFADPSFTKPNKDDVEITIDELPSEESCLKEGGTKLPMITVDGPDTFETPIEDVHSPLPPQLMQTPDLLTLPVPGMERSVKSPRVEVGDTKSVSDVTQKDDEFPKSTESALSPDETKNVSSKDKSLDAFTAQITPQIGSVVSLSRSHYAEDEDEVGSEDPEEAEIPPVIEFSQPEEGLVIDASYALKNSSDRTDDLEENHEVQDNELEDIARVVEDKPDDDSGSSVICLDSDSDGEQKNPTRLDYEDYGEDSYSLDSEEADQSSRGRRSFFHDKYNTHQEESDDSPSPEYSSGDDEKRDSDVDLYNMDDMEENDGMPKDDELDDEIFAMGRGIQERKDLDVSSEDDDEEEEEDMDEEEEDEEEDEEDIEEGGDEIAEITPVTPVCSESSPLVRRLPVVDEDVQEVLSSEEEDVLVGKADSKPQSSQESDSGSSSSDVINPVAKENDSSKDEKMGATHSPVSMQKMQDEDQLAVDALLGLADSPKDENSPEKTEQKTNESRSSKAADVIDILNLSQGQMFFGSPEVQICDKPPDRALFQLGSSPFTPKCNASGDNKDCIVEKVSAEETKPQSGAVSSLGLTSNCDDSKSEETLVLRLEESDIVRAESPEVQDIVTEASPSCSELPKSNLIPQQLGTPEKENILMDERQQEINAKSSSKGCVALDEGIPSEGAASCELACSSAEAAGSSLETMPDSSNNVVQSEKPVRDQQSRTSDAVQSVEMVQESIAEEPAHEPIEKSELPNPKADLLTVSKGDEEQSVTPEFDSSPGTYKISTIESIKTADTVESNITVDCASKSSLLQSSTSPSHQVSLSPLKHQVQNVSFSCQVEPIEVVEEVKPYPPQEKENVVCQTTFIESSPIHVSSKSFSCQAAMDTTNYGIATLPVTDAISPNIASHDTVTSTCREAVDTKQRNTSVHQESPSVLVESPIVATPGTITKTTRTLKEDKHSSSSREKIGDPDLRVTKLVDYEVTIIEGLPTTDEVPNSSLGQIVLETHTSLKDRPPRGDEPPVEDRPSNGAQKIDDHEAGITESSPASDAVANSSLVQITLAPPTPFKTLKDAPPMGDDPSNGTKKIEDSDPGAAKSDGPKAEIAEGLPTSDVVAKSSLVQITLEPPTPFKTLDSDPGAAKSDGPKSEIAEGSPTSDVVAKSSLVQITLEPPKPSKTLEEAPPTVEDPSNGAIKVQDSDLGVAKLDGHKAEITEGFPTSDAVVKSSLDQITLEPLTSLKTPPPMGDEPSNDAKKVEDSDTGAAKLDEHKAGITESLPASDAVANSSLVQVTIPPPTPFKTLKDAPSMGDERSNGTQKVEDSDLGVAKLDYYTVEEQTSDEMALNPCDVAFIGETSFASMTATPKTPMRVTPLRKSLRIHRMSTPGRALAPDDEVNVSDSMLDIAVLDPEVSGEKPVLVDRSMITDQHGPEKIIVAGKSKDTLKGDAKSKKSSIKPSLEKTHKDQKKSLKEVDEARTEEFTVSKDSKSDRFGPVDIEFVKDFSKRLQSESNKRRSTAKEPDVVSKKYRKDKSNRASSSEPKDGERQRKSRHSRASSVDPEHQSSGPKEGSRRRRSSSAQPETRAYEVETEKRKGRRSQSIEQEISQKEPKKDTSSQMLTERKSSHATHDRDRARRHASVEPAAKSSRRDSRRASSEGPSSDVGRGSSRKRQSSFSVDSKDGSHSPSKHRRLDEPYEVSDDGEYRKRKIRHSITEPLEKKKHQLEEQSVGEPKSKMPRRSEFSVEEVSTASSSSTGPPRKSRSLMEYPVRRSMRPSVLAIIQELPEGSPQPTHSKTTATRASAGNLSALDSLMNNTKRIDISKWLALSGSQVARGRRLSGKTQPPASPSKKKDSEHLDIGAFLKTVATPVKEVTSPTGSVASITSTASSKVLRSGRVIDENTPTRRTRELSYKQRAARTLILSSNTPAKVLRSGRSLGDDDRLTATSDAEEDQEIENPVRRSSSPNTSAFSAVSELSDQHHHEMSINEVMSSRRLTRHQRSVLEMSTSRRSLSPVEETPSPVPKRKSKKH